MKKSDWRTSSQSKIVSHHFLTSETENNNTSHTSWHSHTLIIKLFFTRQSVWWTTKMTSGKCLKVRTGREKLGGGSGRATYHVLKEPQWWSLWARHFPPGGCFVVASPGPVYLFTCRTLAVLQFTITRDDRIKWLKMYDSVLMSSCDYFCFVGKHIVRIYFLKNLSNVIWSSKFDRQHHWSFKAPGLHTGLVFTTYPSGLFSSKSMVCCNPQRVAHTFGSPDSLGHMGVMTTTQTILWWRQHKSFTLWALWLMGQVEDSWESEVVGSPSTCHTTAVWLQQLHLSWQYVTQQSTGPTAWRNAFKTKNSKSSCLKLLPRSIQRPGRLRNSSSHQVLYLLFQPEYIESQKDPIKVEFVTWEFQYIP